MHRAAPTARAHVPQRRLDLAAALDARHALDEVHVDLADLVVEVAVKLVETLRELGLRLAALVRRVAQLALLARDRVGEGLVALDGLVVDGEAAELGLPCDERRSHLVGRLGEGGEGGAHVGRRLVLALHRLGRDDGVAEYLHRLLDPRQRLLDGQRELLVLGLRLKDRLVRLVCGSIESGLSQLPEPLLRLRFLLRANQARELEGVRGELLLRGAQLRELGPDLLRELALGLQRGRAGEGSYADWTTDSFLDSIAPRGFSRTWRGTAVWERGRWRGDYAMPNSTRLRTFWAWASFPSASARCLRTRSTAASSALAFS